MTTTTFITARSDIKLFDLAVMSGPYELAVYNDAMHTVWCQPCKRADIVIFMGDKLIRRHGAAESVKILHPVVGLCYIQRIFLSPL